MTTITELNELIVRILAPTVPIAGQIWPISRLIQNGATDAPMPLIVYAHDAIVRDKSWCPPKALFSDTVIHALSAEHDQTVLLVESILDALDSAAECMDYAVGAMIYDTDLNAFIAPVTAQFRL
jgi:hypothetical protein